jgi:hypothetical protein
MIRKRLLTRKAYGSRSSGRPWGEQAWKREELDLLGTLPDAEVAARIGRTVNAVRVKRTKLRIPAARDDRDSLQASEEGSRAARSVAVGSV